MIPLLRYFYINILMNRELTVKFEDDTETFYLINDKGLIVKMNRIIPKKIDILIVRQSDRNKVLNAVKMGYKLFECNSMSREDCLVKVLNTVFPNCKTCKFM
ncbi:hypothetical protein [Saccharolobus islandicus]|uniref:Uncharacterized protein n=1 Tax=Saccharolobus islandicus (strain REY15A) TaxID=930945 RepID=F0NC64_SACI5|nr:hypothetical protein [Sulfolobus islandicus]ADX86503.1 conserved hypothetical protein [Sulfolobus islandicus REY15A]